MPVRYFDREGKPMAGTMVWAKKVNSRNYCRVAETEVGPYWVSTVWLGLDHSFGEGPPLIFETMIFKKDDAGEMDFSGKYQERHATEDEAMKGHLRAVKVAEEAIETGKELGEL